MGYQTEWIMIGCDGKDKLPQALDINIEEISSKQQQFDLLSGIQWYVRVSTLKYMPIHMLRHQDEWILVSDLNWWVLSNIKVDFRVSYF